MATFEQNLAKIRGEAVYAGEVRTAIADALGQVVTAQSDYTQDVENKISDIQEVVDSRELYIQLTAVSGSTTDFRMDITNASESIVG